jgi:hypothetical protein
MKGNKSILQFQDSQTPALFDSHNRLIHPATFQSAIKPTESQKLKQNGIFFPHKNNADFGVILSHDVDHIYSSKTHNTPKYSGGFKNLSQLFFHELKNRLKEKKIVRERNINFDIYQFLDWEYKKNIPASYYFLSLQAGEQDYNYNLEEVEDIFDAIRNSNGEIGLHGGHLSTLTLQKIKEEKSWLEQVTQTSINGFRSHYLKWSPANTELFLNESAFVYDTSWGTPQQPGFVKGFCTPHPVWSSIKNEYLDWIEIPLVAMDCSFFDYMKLNPDSAWSLFIYLVNQVKNANGIITILWHNSYYKNIAFYWKMMDYLEHQNCHFGTSIEFANLAVNSGYIDRVKEYYG